MKLKVLSLLEITLVMSLVFFTPFSFVSSPVTAAETSVCCEQTLSGDFCQQVPSSACAPGSLQAPTSCEQTSFCRPGCCFDKEGDGLCYANYPKALCEQQFNGRFSDDASCSQTLECSQGCCVLGTQSAFTTRVACQEATEQFPDLAMDFRTDIQSEQACISLSRNSEEGCWVDEDSCAYSTHAEKPSESAEFFSGKYCSQIAECDCAASNPSLGGSGDAKATTCLAYDDSVYWRDSCGNPEGLKETCSYLDGSLCGDSDSDGRFTCERLDCSGDAYSFLQDDFVGSSEITEQDVVRNGESWCQYDSALQDDDTEPGGKDPVGSRYYRSLCINGKELIEPCKDFRQEWCADGTVTINRDGREVDFTEARCLENRWEECSSSCNTADPFTMGEGAYQRALSDDQACCLDITQRDCSWVGKCVPKVAPGFQFYEGEGSDICSQANQECPVTFVCNGWNALTGTCDADSAGGVIGSIVAVVGAGVGAALITGTGGGTAWLAAGLASGDIALKQATAGGWQLIAGEHCLSQEYLQASNELCSMQGDCGAAVNYLGDISYTLNSDKQKVYSGFKNTESLSSDFAEVAGGPGFLKDPTLRSDEAIEKYWSSSKKAGGRGSFIERFFWDTQGSSNRGWTRSFTTVVSAGAGVYTAFGFGDVLPQGGATGIGPYGKLVHFVGTGIQKGFFEKSVEDLTKELSEATSEHQTYVSSQYTTTQQLDELDNNIQEAKDSLDAAKNTKAATKAGELQVGAAVSAALWVDFIYESLNIVAEKSKTHLVKTECLAWEAPKLQVAEKEKCELCNPDYKGGDYDAYKDTSGNPLSVNAFKACSEYRCKSLGAQCDLINQGSAEERCVYLGERDVNSPIITPWQEGLSPGYDLVQLPSGGDFKRGFQLVYKGEKQCSTGTSKLPIYDRFLLTLQTDEPSQCKMGWEHSKSFEDMGTDYFGGSLYSYFHAQQMFYPASVNKTSGLSLSGSGDYTLYIRCADAVGNTNDVDYVVEFDVCDAPDLTAPAIFGTSIGETSYLSAGANQTDVYLFLNEAADCKYGFSPLDYASLSEGSCVTQSIDPNTGYYLCGFTDSQNIHGFSSVAGQQLPVYFKCEDQAGNFNAEAFRLVLKGSAPLVINSIEPVSGTNLKTRMAVENVTLKVSTSRGAELGGQSLCKFTQQESQQFNLASMVSFRNTNTSLHTQLLTPATGTHLFYVGCVDLAGNTAFTNTTFSVENDVNAPEIVRAYLDARLGTDEFRIEVNEDLPEAGCRDSIEDPLFTFEEGSVMSKDGTVFTSTHVGAQVYYVQCEDHYGNRMPITTIQFV